MSRRRSQGDGSAIGNDAVIADASDPDRSVPCFRFIGDSTEEADALAKQPGDTVDGR